MRYAVRRGGAVRIPLVGALIPLLALAQPLEAAESDSTSSSCLEEVAHSVPRNARLHVELREGGTLEGDYRGVDDSSLQLRTFDRGASRFFTRDIPGQSVASIGYETRHVSLIPPVLGAVVLGGAGVLVGSWFDDVDNEGSTSGNTNAAKIGLGALGVITGAVFGLAVSSAMAKTEMETFSCEAP